MRGKGFRALSVALSCAAAFMCATLSSGQTPSRTPPSNVSQPGVYLVFPFENAGASPRLDWLGEGLEELTIQRLSAVGQQVYSHAGLTGELERAGLSPSTKLSRASMLRIAQDLDADFVVLSANNHAYSRSLEQFSKAQRPLRLDAFEHYTRGLLANEDEPRIRELHEAARLEPDWPEPNFALGEAYYGRKDYNAALAWYAKVPKSHDRYVEAAFAMGVCRLQLDQPDRAEELFVSLQEALRKNLVSGADLPETLNNLALARARQGKAPAAQADLRRAMDLDPDEDDYPFNLGVLALRGNDFPAAAGFFQEAAERAPDNAENRALMIYALEKAGKKAEADQGRESAAEALGPNALPAIKLDEKGDALSRLERLSMQLDTTALRLEIKLPDSSGSEGAAVVNSADTPTAHLRHGRQELSAGRVDAAEVEFRAILAADPGSPAAHSGLAEIYRRRGKLDDAVKEIQASLQTRDSAVVRTTLARVYLEQKKTNLARAEAERALKLAPNYSEAKQLLEHLQKQKPPGGAQ